jgi:hypothetical protein
VFLLRCLLDPWNTSYYALPFLLALLAWEVHARPGLPLLALAATALAWASFEELPRVASADVQSLAYLAWSVPLSLTLAWRLLDPEGFARRAEPIAAGLRRHMPSLAARVAPPSRALPGGAPHLRASRGARAV